MARKPISFNINPLFAGPSLDERRKSGSPYRELRLEDIDVDPDQPRKHFDDASLAELAESIKAHGVLCPILVKTVQGGAFRIIAGERRFRAAKIANLDTIPAIIDQSENKGEATLPKQLVENLQRTDLNPLERASAIGHLRDINNWSIREIATNLGISKGMVQRSLEVLSLPDDLKMAIEDGKHETKVLLLAQIEDRELRKIFLDKLDELSRLELEQQIKKTLNEEGGENKVYRDGTAKEQARKNQLSTQDQRIVNELQRNLGTKVELIRKKKNPNQGKIQIDFYSEDDLNSIFKKLIAI